MRIVFWAFDALDAGEAFFLVNDHDPRPLRMQMDILYPGEMGWEYMRQAPSEYRITISRLAAAKKAPADTTCAPALA